jgi:uncharacterized membrane protein
MKKWWAFFIFFTGCFCISTVAFAQTTSTLSEERGTSSPTMQESIQATSTIDRADLNANPQYQGEEQSDGTYASARIISVKISNDGDINSGTQKQQFEVEIRSGLLKGKTITIEEDTESTPLQIHPKKGDKIIVFIQQGDHANPAVRLEGFDRRIPMYWIIALFILSILFISGRQGIKTIFSIIISIGLIGWILIPAFINGINPIPITIIISGIFALISSGFAFGWNKNAFLTALGTIGGTIFALIILITFSSWAQLNGLSSEVGRQFFSLNPTLHPTSLLFASVIIASMSVIADIIFSIASGIEQIAHKNPGISFKTLFTSGMILGKNHAAMMIHVIIFVSIGASLSTFLLYTQYDSNWLKFINIDSVTQGIIHSISASIGLLFSIPITAILSAWFNHSKNRPEGKKKSLVHITNPPT